MTSSVTLVRADSGARDLRAFPLLEAVGLECRAAGMGTPDASNSTTSYGDGIFVDLRSRKVCSAEVTGRNAEA